MAAKNLGKFFICCNFYFKKGERVMKKTQFNNKNKIYCRKSNVFIAGCRFLLQYRHC